MTALIGKWTTLVTPANPAAGAGLVYNVPAGRRYLIRALRAVLVCSGTVANRTPYVELSIGGQPVYLGGAAASVAAGTTTVICAGIGAPSQQSAWTTLLTIYIPEVWLPGDNVGNFQLNANNLQAGDQLSGIGLVIEHD